MKAVKTS